MTVQQCPLCAAEGREFFTHYWLCPRCDLRFLDPRFRLSRAEEHDRYDLHQNLSTDSRYREFVSPAVQAIQNQMPAPALGLDFGSGADSALAAMLRESGYTVALYDPKYFPDTQVLVPSYDFIAATEVLEHLHNPQLELQRLCALLKSGGILVLMTHIFSSTINFGDWYYRRDPTHVAFYSVATLHFIRQQFGFSHLQVMSDRLACLTRK